MTRIIDVVNFNSDASCLSAQAWLEALDGGETSLFCRWLKAYVDHEKKVVLGLIGATVADIAVLNPEAIDLINAYPEIFQLIYRPYVHDIALLRSPRGFELNVELGRKALQTEFPHRVPFFLPPEFMVTGEQIRVLSRLGMEVIFINASRFSKDIQQQIPTTPYRVKGVLDSSLICIPFEGKLTSCFLESLYRFDASPWNGGINGRHAALLFAWRDGESAFLIPQGVEREENWLRNEAPDIRREFLPDTRSAECLASPQNPKRYYSSYPVHSFSRWMKEFRMLGYIQRVQEIEKKVDQLSPRHLALWFQTINSDILSAVEKHAHRIRLSVKDSPVLSYEHVIQRSERGFEGEDYLSLLEASLEHQASDYGDASHAAHMQKLRARLKYMERLFTNERQQ